MIGTNSQSFKAGADLSGNQYYFVKADTTEGQVVLFDGTGSPLGILMNQPASGQGAEVALEGGAFLKCGAGATAGAQLKAASTGKGALCVDEDDEVSCRADAMAGTSSDGDVIAVILDRQDYSKADGAEGHGKVKTAVALYDFATDGGAAGDISLGTILPDNAIILNGRIDILTAMASAGGAGTIALKLAGANDILSAVDADTLSGIVATVPVGSAATSFKLTAAKTLTATVGTEALTAGKFMVFLDYYVSI